jgi:hypothetical protein
VYKTKRGQLCIVMDYADGEWQWEINYSIGGDLSSLIKRQKEKGGFMSED